MARTLATKIDNNNVTVSSAGTSVQFDTAKHPVRYLKLHTPVGNSGLVYVGGSAVSATRGFPMAANTSIEFTFAGDVLLSDWWVDAATNGDILVWLAEFK